MKQSVRQVQPRNIENRDRHARRASADLLVRARQQVLDRTTRVPTPFEGFDDRGDTAGSNNSAILVTDSQHQISVPAKLDRDDADRRQERFRRAAKPETKWGNAEA
jgi:hypothetical protein